MFKIGVYTQLDTLERKQNYLVCYEKNRAGQDQMEAMLAQCTASWVS